MSDELAISVRNLGVIALKNYCPACLAFLLKLRFKPPYSSFGAQIFGDAQRTQEAILGHYLDQDGCLPKEFSPFCDCVERVACSKRYTSYRHTHKTGVVLYGEPDEVLRRKDDSICIIDHKTARNRGDDDRFHGQYEVQVVGYAFIAEGLGLGTVTKAGLLYWEAQPEVVQADPSAHYKGGVLSVPFKPSPLEVAVDYAILDPLIKELKSVWSSKEQPLSRQGCNDCAKREILLSIDEAFRNQDRSTALYMAEDPGRRWAAARRLHSSVCDRRRLVEEFRTLGNALYATDGVLAAWDFGDGTTE